MEVEPGPLPGRVSESVVGAELVDQHTNDVPVVVDSSDVQRSVAARRLSVNVKGQAGLLYSVPERVEDAVVSVFSNPVQDSESGDEVPSVEQ